MACDQGPLHLRQHRVLEAQNAGPDILALGQCGQQIFPDFLLDPRSR
ncbi:mg-chelatase subunit ChlI-like domain protein [Mycobacterium kansasii]|uniref:Mg-chelatase subunit ChlI-like domain protein n=1 Tax=Mycobacterium kansasii TaxID=1768 RepID=A0A1V3XGI6_MYCKA|nr:mg-chelatase subunit ChlI-like domain protein [Mycobacterium kansasii]OOK80687.1 mg-chelatase subunit ChlI-like domain protein [Mycobacterium kansasii]